MLVTAYLMTVINVYNRITTIFMYSWPDDEMHTVLLAILASAGFLIIVATENQNKRIKFVQQKFI